MASCRLFIPACLALIPGCYDEAEPPDKSMTDGNGDGAPDDIGPDPVLDGDSGYAPGDWDGDGLTDDEDLDDDNDFILDDLPDRELVDVVRPIAEAECDAVAGCCAQGWPIAAMDTCTLETVGNLVLALAQSWADAFFDANEAGLQACLDAQGLDCSAPWGRRAPQACRSYIVGARAEQAACYQTPDCVAELVCSDREGEARYGPGLYVTQLYWANELGACLTPGVEGDECPPVATRPCREGLVCDEGLCRRSLEAGEACAVAGDATRSDDCASGLFCHDGGEGPTCVDRRAVGDPCLEDRECLSSQCDARLQRCTGSASGLDACAEAARYQ